MFWSWIWRSPERVRFGEGGAVTPCRRVEDRKGAGTNSGKSGTLRRIGDWEHQKQGGEYVRECVCVKLKTVTEIRLSTRESVLHWRLWLTDWLHDLYLTPSQHLMSYQGQTRDQIASLVWLHEEWKITNWSSWGLFPTALFPETCLGLMISSRLCEVSYYQIGTEWTSLSTADLFSHERAEAPLVLHRTTIKIFLTCRLIWTSC